MDKSTTEGAEILCGSVRLANQLKIHTPPPKSIPRGCMDYPLFDLQIAMTYLQLLLLELAWPW